MSKNFKNVSSFEDLKAQYRELLKANHPDNGGDVERMQEINVEYDALFKIWKDRHEATTGEAVKETAESTRRQFYTAFGWEGSRYDDNLTLKEIAAIVRAYVKEKYPTYKFSVRTHYASMCRELSVTLKEAPEDIYNHNPETWTNEQRHEAKRRFEFGHTMPELTIWTDNELTEWLRAGLEKVNYRDCYAVKKEDVQAMFEDVDAFVNSYNYDDCDGQIDYFDVNFYYFNCQVADDLKIVPKAARIKKQSSEPATTSAASATAEETAPQLEKKGYTFNITPGEDTRDGSALWVVRIVETLTREEYIRINNNIKEIGGYYSKFRHGFIFRFNPFAKLQEIA